MKKKPFQIRFKSIIKNNNNNNNKEYLHLLIHRVVVAAEVARLSSPLRSPFPLSWTSVLWISSSRAPAGAESDPAPPSSKPGSAGERTEQHSAWAAAAADPLPSCCGPDGLRGKGAYRNCRKTKRVFVGCFVLFFLPEKLNTDRNGYTHKTFGNIAARGQRTSEVSG